MSAGRVRRSCPQVDLLQGAAADHTVAISIATSYRGAIGIYRGGAIGVYYRGCYCWERCAIRSRFHRGCYRDYDRDLLLVMQRIYRAGDDDVSAMVTSRGGMSQWHTGPFMLAFVGRGIR